MLFILLLWLHSCEGSNLTQYYIWFSAFYTRQSLRTIGENEAIPAALYVVEYCYQGSTVPGTDWPNGPSIVILFKLSSARVLYVLGVITEASSLSIAFLLILCSRAPPCHGHMRLFHSFLASLVDSSACLETVL